VSMAGVALFDPVTVRVARAFRWWLGELRTFVPERMWGAARRINGLVLECEGATVRLKDEAASGSSGGVGWEPMSLREAIALASMRQPSRALTVRLSHEQCFVRLAQLPELARAEFARMLDLQMRQSMPFKATDVYQAHFITGRRGKLASVIHVIARRSAIDPVLEACRAAGVEVAAVDCRGTDESILPINFLGPPVSAKGGRSAGWLLAIAALLTVAAVGTDMAKREAALAGLQSDTRTLRDKVRLLQERRAMHGELDKQVEKVELARAARPTATEIVEELSRLLPDTTVLQAMRLDGANVEISGLAASASDLLPLLEASRLFRDVRLVSPVSVDGQDGRERFGLRLQVQPGKAAADRPGSRT
jgi:general secretion pathway protein L